MKTPPRSEHSFAKEQKMESLSEDQKYDIEMHRQAMRQKLREMLRCQPSSIEHRIKLIAYDRMRLELEAMKGGCAEVLFNGAA